MIMNRQLPPKFQPEFLPRLLSRRQWSNRGARRDRVRSRQRRQSRQRNQRPRELNLDHSRPGVAAAVEAGADLVRDELLLHPPSQRNLSEQNRPQQKHLHRNHR